MSDPKPIAEKPYDIRERVFQYVCTITAVYPRDRYLDAPSRRAWSQLFDSASSTGAHLEEAFAASSRRHFRVLNRGALREMRESHYWLRVIVAGRLAGSGTLGNIVDEARQLVAIITTIVKNSGGDEPNVGTGRR